MNYIHWNPPTDIINLGFFAIRWYGMLWGIGLIGATYIVARLFKEYKIADSKFASLFVYVFFGVLYWGHVWSIACFTNLAISLEVSNISLRCSSPFAFFPTADGGTRATQD